MNKVQKFQEYYYSKNLPKTGEEVITFFENIFKTIKKFYPTIKYTRSENKGANLVELKMEWEFGVNRIRVYSNSQPDHHLLDNYLDKIKNELYSLRILLKMGLDVFQVNYLRRLMGYCILGNYERLVEEAENYTGQDLYKHLPSAMPNIKMGIFRTKQNLDDLEYMGFFESYN